MIELTTSHYKIALVQELPLGTRIVFTTTTANYEDALKIKSALEECYRCEEYKCRILEETVKEGKVVRICEVE
jgi:hypothetical protein